MLHGGSMFIGTNFRPPPLLHSRYSSRTICQKRGQVKTGKMSSKRLPSSASAICTSSLRILATAAVAVAVSAAIFCVAAEAGADTLTNRSQQQQQESESETLANIPQTLSGACIPGKEDCKKPRIQRPKSRKAEICTVKCVNTCIRGSPGEGPLNVRRPLVVFKQGFRSRQYCLVECSDICNLIGDGDDGP